MRHRRPFLAATAGLSVACLGLSAAAGPTTGTTAAASADLRRPLVGPEGGGFPGAQLAVGDRDARGPQLPPLPEAAAAVAALPGDLDVAWTQYGTVRTLVRKDSGWLAAAIPGSPAVAARSFLRSHSELFGLSSAEVDALELYRDTKLNESSGHAVMFRQIAQGIPLAEDGLITVALKDGLVAGVTGSAAGSSSLNTTKPVLQPVDAVLAAAKDAGVTTLTRGMLSLVGKVDSGGFTLVHAKGLAQTQRARLRVLPTTDRGLRLAYETDVLDVAGTNALATISFVDAVDGKVLLRRDAVDTLASGTAASAGLRSVSTQGLPAAAAAPSGGTISGTYSATACSAKAPLTVPTRDSGHRGHSRCSQSGERHHHRDLQGIRADRLWRQCDQP